MGSKHLVNLGITNGLPEIHEPILIYFKLDLSNKMLWNLNKILIQETIYENVQWNLSVTTTSIIKIIACDLFSNVFQWRLKVPIYSC